MPLLGIPGAIWMMPGETLIPLIYGRRPHGDTAWPTALMITLIWPWFIPLFYALLFPLTRPGRPRFIAVAAAVSAASVATALVVQRIALG